MSVTQLCTFGLRMSQGLDPGQHLAAPVVLKCPVICILAVLSLSHRQDGTIVCFLLALLSVCQYGGFLFIVHE